MLKGVIIGCGSGGRLHLSAWQRVRTARIEAATDRDRPRAARAAHDFRIPRHYDDLDGALAGSRLDFADLAVDVDARPLVARKCLENGLHVLAEAPLCTNLTTARELVELAESKNLRLMVAYRERWRSSFRALKRQIESGAVGPVHYMRVFARRPLGRSRPVDPRRPGLDRLQHLVVLEGLLGYVDLVRYLFGEVKSVWGQIASLNPAVKGEDFALAALRTVGDNPVAAMLDVNWSSPLPGREVKRAPGPDVRLEGAGGALELDFAASVMRVRGHTGKPREIPLPPVPDRRMEPYIELLGHFAECLESGAEPDAGGHEALHSLEAALAVYESARSGGLVLIEKP